MARGKRGGGVGGGEGAVSLAEEAAVCAGGGGDGGRARAGVGGRVGAGGGSLGLQLEQFGKRPELEVVVLLGAELGDRENERQPHRPRR